jgi:hypothetical protein
VELDPGRPLRVAVDVSALEDPSSRDRSIGRCLLGQFRELMNLRPHWTFTAFGVHGEPQLPVLREFVEQVNGGYARWGKLLGARPDVLYLPDPLGATAHELLKAVRDSNLFIACTFFDLAPLLRSDERLKPDPDFKAMYLWRLAQLRDRCDLFLCTSQATAQDLQAHLQIALSRLRIIQSAESSPVPVWPKVAEKTAMYLTEAIEHRTATRPQESIPTQHVMQPA